VELVAMLFFGYFSCLIAAFTVVAMWLIGSFNYSMVEKRHHPRPPIEQSITPEVITPEQIAPLHLEVTKEASTSKSDVSPVKRHKHKMLARQRNNNYGYGNTQGYADAYRNGQQRLWSNW
jgi:hypothetical protein